MLFVIDVSASMLKPPPASTSRKADRDSPLAASLKCAYQIMQQRIIAQPKDLMGILFFGTEKTKFRDESEGSGSSGHAHCYLFMDLDVPSAEDVRTLKRLVEDGDDPDDVLVPSSEPVVMANVLFGANQILTQNAPNFGSRRIFIITDNDSPHAGDIKVKNSAAVRAKDLYDLGVTIELFPLSKEGQTFDLGKFYNVSFHTACVDSETKNLRILSTGIPPPKKVRQVRSNLPSPGTESRSSLLSSQTSTQSKLRRDRTSQNSRSRSPRTSPSLSRDTS